MIYAVDFDGTLCANMYPKIGQARTAVLEFIREAKDNGGTIILWTCREGELLDRAVEWCRSNKVPIDYVNENVPAISQKFGSDCRKIYADFYIDDKALNVDDLIRRNILRELSPPV